MSLLLEVLRSSSWSARTNALVWLLITLVADGAAFLGSYILIPVWQTDFPVFFDLIKHGQLTLFSLSMLGLAIYILYKGVRVPDIGQEESDQRSGLGKIALWTRKLNFPGFGFFLLTTGLLGLISAFLFAGLMAAQMSDTASLVHVARLVNWSVVVMCITAIVVFFMVMVENTITENPPDPRDLYERGYQEFDEAFSEKRGRNG